jgi:two-component sensor histidine kinase
MAFTNNSKKSIRVYTKLDAVELTTKLATLIGFILFEVLLNSIQHAFTRKTNGIISIVMVPCGKKQVLLEVSDNGKGIESTCENGIGTELIELLAQQLRATVKRISSPRGTTVKLQVPLGQ